MTLRPIDNGKLLPISAEPGDCPVLDWLNVDDLVLDDIYQRPLLHKNWKHIVKIAATFSWQRFSAVTVSRRPDGKYAIIDGQHRAHAAALCGIRQVPCLIHNISVADQAAAFSSINGTVQAMTLFHVYRAALAAREEWAINAEAVAKAAECKMMTSNSSAANKKPGEIYCIKVVSSMVEAGEGEAVIEGLKAIRKSHLQSEVEAYQMKFLRPWLRAVASNVQNLKADLAQFLDDTDVFTIMENASMKAKIQGKSRSAIVEDEFTARLREWVKSNRPPR